MDRKIELLSPARDVNVARSAILAGADAVYIGADAFGARSAASNAIEDIAKLCDFAHLYGCRVCVTLNTILSDSEIPRAADMAKKLFEAKVDALIVQDLGLIKYGLPPMPIHASTQCHITTANKAKFLAACGFDTLVLARELSLSEIRNISDAVDVRLEAFVHGALCVSYSGQCYLSYAIGGRSGNRGECAQPCRMEYEFLDADGNGIASPAYFLSLRDMNRSKSVGDMIDAGIDIFKIEGRLKDAGYVKNITALYRKNIDVELKKRGLKKSSYGESTVSFEPDAKKSFNRMFCEYHLKGTEKNCSSFETPKARGEYLGEIRNAVQGGFMVDGADKIFSNGDGLVLEHNGETMGVAVQKVFPDRVYVGRPEERIFIPRGTKVWRNKDVNFDRLSEAEAERKMKIKIFLSETSDAFLFMAKTDDDRAAESKVAVPKSEVEIAQNAETGKEKIAQNLSKLGGTEFEAGNVEVSAKNIPFLRASQTNDIRRKLVDGLKFDIIRRYDVAQKKFAPRKPALDSFCQAPFAADMTANVHNSYAKDFYKQMGFDISEPSPESAKFSMQNKRVMTTRHCILRELNLCKKTSAKKSKEPLRLRNNDVNLELKFDCNLCQMEIYKV